MLALVNTDNYHTLSHYQNEAISQVCAQMLLEVLSKS